MNYINKLNEARDYSIKANFKKRDEILASLESKVPGVNLLKFDLTNSKNGNGLLQELKNSNSNYITGLFSCSYHPYLNLEWAETEIVQPSFSIHTNLNLVKCVTLKNGTSGILHPQVVAIFPENFKNHHVEIEDPVFYFANKFLNRFLQYNRKNLKNSLWSDVFQPIFSLDHQTLQIVISNWVHLHEFFHRVGEMPIPKYLDEKSKRLNACFEELRVDLLAIKYCLENNNNENPYIMETGLYILAERLISYPFFRDKDNFDSLSSILFWDHLKKEKVITKTKFKYEKLTNAMTTLIDEIMLIEKMAVKFNDKELRKNYILKFVENKLKNKDIIYKDFFQTINLIKEIQ